MSQFNPDPPHNFFAELIRKRREAERFDETRNKAIRDAIQERTNDLEKDVLMDLWQHLGDHTRNYQQAFALAATFQECIGKTRKLVFKQDADQRTKLLRAIAQTILAMADMHEAATAAKEEAEKNAPPEIADAIREMHRNDD